MLQYVFGNFRKLVIVTLLTGSALLVSVGESQAVHKKGQRPRPSLKKVRPAANPIGNAFIGVTVEANPGGGDLVDVVIPNSRADNAGIEPGDVILSADGGGTNTPFQLSNRIQTDRANNQPFVNLQVIDVRTGVTETIQVPLQAVSSAIKKHR